MFFNKNIKYKDILILMVIVVVGYILIKNYNVFFVFIRGFLSVVSPFIYALIIAYCLNPLMKVFEKKIKFKRGVSVALTYIIVLSLIALGFIYVLPYIINSIISIISSTPKYIEILQVLMNDALKHENLKNLIGNLGLLDNLSTLASKLGTTIMAILQESIFSIFSVTSNLIKIILGFIISIYVLIDKERFIRGTKMLIYMTFREEGGYRFIEWAKIYHRMVGIYIGTKAIDSTIIGFITLVGLIIIDAPYYALIALFVGITNMVPYLGPLVGQIIGAFIGLFVSSTMAITIFLFLFIVQQFDAWYLDPKLIGGKVGVRPFFIILGLIIGGSYFGVIGMLLASPTMATINIYFSEKVAMFRSNNSSIIKHIEDNDKNSPKN